MPGQNGTSEGDQAGTIYSKISDNVLHATAPLPIMTYKELKYIEADLTVDMIYIQKYIHLWPFGSFEAFAEWRRTGYPTLTNPFETPRRFPYPQNEISGNADNVPNVTAYNVVW